MNDKEGGEAGAKLIESRATVDERKLKDEGLDLAALAG